MLDGFDLQFGQLIIDFKGRLTIAQSYPFLVVNFFLVIYIIPSSQLMST